MSSPHILSFLNYCPLRKWNIRYISCSKAQCLLPLQCVRMHLQLFGKLLQKYGRFFSIFALWPCDKLKISFTMCFLYVVSNRCLPFINGASLQMKSSLKSLISSLRYVQRDCDCSLIHS